MSSPDDHVCNHSRTLSSKKLGEKGFRVTNSIKSNKHPFLDKISRRFFNLFQGPSIASYPMKRNPSASIVVVPCKMDLRPTVGSYEFVGYYVQAASRAVGVNQSFELPKFLLEFVREDKDACYYKVESKLSEAAEDSGGSEYVC